MAQTAATIVTFGSTGEATWGSTGNPTKKFHGLTAASLKIDQSVEVVNAVGWYGPSGIANIQADSGSGSLEFVASYEDMPAILNNLFTYTSASTGNSTGGTTAPYNYTWTAPVSSTQIVATYPIEISPSTAYGYKLRGGIMSNLTLRGEAGGYWTGSVDLLGKYVEALSVRTTAGDVDRTVNPIRVANTSLYLDAHSTGTIGTTLTSGRLISFEFGYNPNRHTKLFAGSINPGGWGDGRAETSLKMVWEFQSSAKADIDEALGSTGAAVKRLIRLQATQGSSATLKTFQVNYAGIKVDGETLFSDRDGNVTVETNWQGMYSTAISNYATFYVENGSSSTT